MINLNFIKADEALVQVCDIAYIDLSKLETELLITIHCQSAKDILPISHVATNLNAIEILMQLKPSAMEGKNLKWARNKWILHNLIAHPLMQILALFKFYKLAIKVHDNTVPKPIGKRQNTQEK